MGAGLALRSVRATDALREHNFDYFSLRLLTTVAAVLAVAGVAWSSGYGTHTATVILIVGIAKGLESISDIVHGLWQQHERMDLIAGSLVLKGVLSLGVVAVAVYFTGDLRVGACGLVFVWALVLLSYDARWAANVSGVVRPLRLRWRSRTLGALAWLALPAGVVMALVSFNINVPRYFMSIISARRNSASSQRWLTRWSLAERSSARSDNRRHRGCRNITRAVNGARFFRCCSSSSAPPLRSA
jgi:O-antigen/teichoic acid export membrane protein